MKLSYLIAIGLIVIAGVFIVTNKPVGVIAPTEEAPVVETGDSTPTATEHDMIPEEHATMMDSSTMMGTDVGMEMPETDMSGMADIKAESKEKMFMVTGTNFAFDVKEIRVKEGDTVTVHFMSDDGFHDLVIDEFNARTEKIKTGGVAMVTFIASKKGVFEYYCSVGSHRMNGMVGKLIVE